MEEANADSKRYLVERSRLCYGVEEMVMVVALKVLLLLENHHRVGHRLLLLGAMYRLLYNRTAPDWIQAIHGKAMKSLSVHRPRARRFQVRM